MGGLFIVVSPHKLSQGFINDIYRKCEELGYDTQLFNSQTENYKEINICTEAGVLLELYTLFGQCFVGGGFDRSIHSVLEPFLAGCMVYCGPKIHRSTEYEYILTNAPEKIKVINGANDFEYNVLEREDVFINHANTLNYEGQRIIGEISSMSTSISGRI